MAAAQPPTRRKLVLVTGATGGIGKATALAFAATGDYNLALHYHTASPEHERDVLADACQAANPTDIKARFFRADLSSYADARRLHAQVQAELGDPDVLFNNAGTTGGVSAPASLADVPIDVFDATWRTNAGSAVLLAQLCLPAMEAQGWGRLVFNSSVAGFTGGAVGPHYAASKAALHGFVHWLAGNVARKGVTVNAVAPALVAGTKMVGGLDPGREGGGEIPVGRLGMPEEVAETVMWLVKCGYVTNKVIGVDGGMYPY
ncbi:NAD(P)-binding protein [Polychaeton citri CBS 116435]|uniref:NAD(P)-binding protein n=1 Tax=Polychaeton citri CBS 116435 TaxID=1314669 RepID=A0A9P4Q7T9_9PEZI|nr:NAD(P)-binding protein [Polychaeton citri CBS 116435]